MANVLHAIRWLPKLVRILRSDVIDENSMVINLGINHALINLSCGLSDNIHIMFCFDDGIKLLEWSEK